ncbi:MAG: GatB/YqeY domain-containing protein [Tenericutes bacterium]|nr:GatB/YqeY domain-containing protein [Mycoplasmatota bacterium]
MFEKITKDLTEAMKAKDTFRTSVLRMLKSALKNEEINKKSPLTDDEVLAIIKKQVKTRKDSMNEYASYNRMDLADSLQKEIDILNEYLPEELSDEELEKIVKETITKVKAESIKQMGMVIKTISSEYGARCDMAKVSKLVKEKLS